MTDPVTDVTDVTEIDPSTWAALLLDEVQEYLENYAAYPTPESATAHTLWIVHTHLIDEFDNSPRIAFLSPEPGSGKSRCLELTEDLVPRPIVSVNSSTAYVFRKISDPAGLPTLLMDEVDAVFSKSKGDGNEDLRGLLNSGYRKGATAGRAVIRGKEVYTEEFPSFCAVALAGLNQLPDTLMSRSIIIPMKKRRRGKVLQPYRRRVNRDEAEQLRNRLAFFADSVRAEISSAWPELPAGIEDRDADLWEPLLMIADAVGGHWPTTSRDAAVRMVEESKSKPVTLGIHLLADIRTVMDSQEKHHPPYKISTSDLLEYLHAMETSPWGNIKGQPIDARFLARMLSKYDIPTNNTIRIGDRSVKGYQRQHFADAWDRYLPAPALPNSGNTGNTGNPQGDDDTTDNDDVPLDWSTTSFPATPSRPLCPSCGGPSSEGNAAYGYLHPTCDPGPSTTPEDAPE